MNKIVDMDELGLDGEVRNVLTTIARAAGISPNAFVRQLLGLRALETEDHMPVEVIDERPEQALVVGYDGYPWEVEARRLPALSGIVRLLNECVRAAVP